MKVAAFLGSPRKNGCLLLLFPQWYDPRFLIIDPYFVSQSESAGKRL